MIDHIITSLLLEFGSAENILYKGILSLDKRFCDGDYIKATQKLFAEESPRDAYIYAMRVIGGRFELGEPMIATDPRWSFNYAKNIIRGRFELGEEAISKHLIYSRYYVGDILQYPREHFKSSEALFRIYSNCGYV